MQVGTFYKATEVAEYLTFFTSNSTYFESVELSTELEVLSFDPITSECRLKVIAEAGPIVIWPGFAPAVENPRRSVQFPAIGVISINLEKKQLMNVQFVGAAVAGTVFGALDSPKTSIIPCKFALAHL